MKHTKKHLYGCITIILTAIVVLSGCSLIKQTAKPVEQVKEEIQQPVELEYPWINKTPTSRDTLFAVGVSNERGNIPISRKNAGNQARVEMAQVIETKVKALFDGFLKEHADLLDPEAPTTSEEFSRMVTRLATDETIVGSQIAEYCWDKTNHLYYALAMIPAENIATQIKQQTEELIRQRKAAIAEENLDEALERMDEVLKNWDVSEE